jgi:hypothetical protein
MAKEKKAFKDTTFGKILNKAGNVLPDVAGLAFKAITGNPMGAVEDAIGHLTGKKDAASVSVLNDLTIKKAEIELEFARVELQETQAYLADTQNARSREIAMANSGKSDWFMYVVGILVLGAFLGVVYVALFVEVKDENLFYFISGNVFSMVMTVVAYFYGSSKGSKDKTKLIK